MVFVRPHVCPHVSVDKVCLGKRFLAFYLVERNPDGNPARIVITRAPHDTRRSISDKEG